MTKIDLNQDVPTRAEVELNNRIENLIGRSVLLIDETQGAFPPRYPGILHRTQRGTLWVKTDSGATRTVFAHHQIEITDGAVPTITMRKRQK